jgi:hypothetical protein
MSPTIEAVAASLEAAIFDIFNKQRLIVSI